MTTELTFTVLCPFGGSGGGALGFLDAEVRLLGAVGRFRCLGSIDVDAVACEDFERLTGSSAWCADVEAITPEEIRARFGQRAPDVVFSSPPCKGSSRLLSAKKAQTAKYARMNELALVWTRRMLAAWPDPPPLVLVENVPGLPTRARKMLRDLRKLLRAAGYVLHASTHDCGEIGGLAQRRKRYLLVARHPKKCPPILYQPPKRRVRACGEVLEQLPMPATVAAREWGGLHEMPRLTWRNWLRLALIPAGGDWRDLEGVLAAGQPRREVFGKHRVEGWDASVGAVAGPGSNGVCNVSDPRVPLGCAPRAGNWSTYGVTPWDEPLGVVAGESSPSNGRYSVADPRVALRCAPHPGAYGVAPWDEPSKTVAGASKIDNRPVSVADPRALELAPSEGRHWNKYSVEAWDAPAHAVIGKLQLGSGRPAAADPRVAPNLADDLRVSTAYDAGYGVLRWEDPARTVAGKNAMGCGAYAVAEPRERLVDDARVMSLDEALALDLDPAKRPPFVPVIVARDGTWHRPLTLLELAALQSYPARVAGEPIRFAGTRTQVAEHIGNSVPPHAARAIADQMLTALVQARLEAFALSAGAVWVSPEDRADAGACA